MDASDGTAAEMFQLDRATCMALLTTQSIGRLVIGGRDASVMPVTYVLAGEEITFRTEAGSRARRSPGAAVFEVDMFDERTRSGWSVIVRGELRPSPDRPVRPTLEPWAPGPRATWMTLTVDVVTGRLLRGAVDASADRACGYL